MQIQTTRTSDTGTPLVPLAKFKSSGECPVEPYHLIFHHKASLVEAGAIVPFGNRWLVDKPCFFAWLRGHGARGAGQP